MSIIVKINKQLQKLCNNTSEFSISIEDYYDVFSALNNYFPKLKEYLTINKGVFQDIAIVHNGKVIKGNNLKAQVNDPSPIYIVPLIFGSQQSYDFTDLYKDIKASSIYPLFGLSTAVSEQSDFEGLDRRIVESSLFRNAERVYDVGLRKNNDIFSSLKLNTNANLPVGLIYGMTRVSGTVINSYVKNYRCDPDIFRVKDVIVESSE